MAAPKKTKFKVIPNPELQAAGRGFTPVWGSAEDLDIVERAMRLDKLLRTVDNEILRGDPKKHTSKMKEILQQEKYLISSITRRNMDF